MERKKLTKKQLLELIFKNPNPEIYSDILNTEEVKSLMYHQWKNPHMAEHSAKPDFKQLFEKIKERTHPEKAHKSENTIYLIREIDELKLDNVKLRRRIRMAVAIAASILLLIGIGTAYFIRSTHPFEVTYTENIAPKGQKSQVVLPDGTHVFLNSGSMLRYDNKFGKSSRNLSLSGEAYFEVKHNEDLPFIINAENIEVKVLGTKFNVMAYRDDNLIETTVTEGKVLVLQTDGNAHLNLLANQKATYHKNSGLLLLKDVNPESSVCWKDNMLTFDNENFASVIKKLERWYNVSINVSGQDSLVDRFTLTIRNESLKEVLDLISLTTPIDYTIKDSKVSIHYK